MMGTVKVNGVFRDEYVISNAFFKMNNKFSYTDVLEEIMNEKPLFSSKEFLKSFLNDLIESDILCVSNGLYIKTKMGINNGRNN